MYVRKEKRRNVKGDMLEFGGIFSLAENSPRVRNFGMKVRTQGGLPSGGKVHVRIERQQAILRNQAVTVATGTLLTD